MRIEATVTTNVPQTSTTFAEFSKSNGFAALSRDEMKAVDFTNIPVTLAFGAHVGRVVESHVAEDGTWRVLINIEDMTAYERFLEASPQKRVQLTTSTTVTMNSLGSGSMPLLSLKLKELSLVKESTWPGASWIEASPPPPLTSEEWDVEVKLIMGRCKCSAETAQAALQMHDNDIVEAIMALTFLVKKDA